MSELKIGGTAPAISLPTDLEKNITVRDYVGHKNVVIYFYPKNDTSGCTKESIEFQAHITDFARHDTIIIGVSKDPVESHLKFRKKYNLTFDTLSDSNGVCEEYGVWVEKSMYGKKYMGIERSTFLIDKNGKIANIWRKVKVTNHVADVLQYVSTNLG